MRHRAAAAAAAVAAVLVLAQAAHACTSFAFDCGDGVVVHVRTMDFDEDLIGISTMTFLPASMPQQGLPLTKDGAAVDLGTTKYSVLGPGLTLPGRPPYLWDGMNSKGLGLGLLWQSNVTFHKAYDPQGPAKAISLVDLAHYLLANYANVAEVKQFLDPNTLQIVTNFKSDTAIDAMIGLVLASDPDIPQPDADGTMYAGGHFAIADATGAGLLLEALPDGSFTTYDTAVVTNEPSWPLMMEWRDEYMAHNFSDVPGVNWWPYPRTDARPAVVPFNSELDASASGYMGSMSRNLRTWLALQNCTNYPWPNASWSPGGANASADPPQPIYEALKRAENILGAVVVPRSQLVGDLDSSYCTQLSMLRSPTEGAYYYKSPQNNQWNRISVTELDASNDGSGKLLSFPMGPELMTPFAIERTGQAEPMAFDGDA